MQLQSSESMAPSGPSAEKRSCVLPSPDVVELSTCSALQHFPGMDFVGYKNLRTRFKKKLVGLSLPYAG